MATKRKSIDFLNPINPPTDIWTTIYNWVFKVGRFLLVGIEILLLAVFFSRFILDEKNNDLTKEINDKVDILSNSEFKSQEITFSNTHQILADVKLVERKQILNSAVVSEITSAIPSNLKLERFTLSADKVSLALTSKEINYIKDYEYSLRKNDKFNDVIVNINKGNSTENEINVTVTFTINKDNN